MSLLVWAYVLEVVDKEDERENQPLFQMIQEMDVEYDNIIVDDTQDQPELKNLLGVIPKQDSILVRSIVDLAGSTQELQDTLSVLSEKKILLCSCEEPYLSGDGYMEQLQGWQQIFQQLKNKKQRLAYQKAVSEGKVGRPPKGKEIEKVVGLYHQRKLSFEQAQALTGLSRSTLYRYLKEE